MPDGEDAMARLLREMVRDESGQDMIEYALVAALVGLGAVTAMKSLAAVFGNMIVVGTRLTGLV